MGKIIMSELADRLAEKAGIEKRVAQTFLSAVIDTIRDGVNNDKIVKIKGLGTFKVIDVDARESVNVNTGERVVISSHQKLTFTPDASMKDLVNKPFSQFDTVVLNEGVDFDNLNSSENIEAEPSEEEKPITEEVQNDSDTTVELPEVIEETPIQEEPVQEEVPVQEEETPILVEEPVQDVEEEEVPIQKDEAPTQEEDTTNQSYWWLWLIIFIIACVLSFAGGYLLGSHKHRTSENTMQTESLAPAPSTKVAPSELKDTLNKDTLSTNIKTETVSQEKPKSTNVAPQQQKEDSDWKKYEEKDARVRTGAYKIVGTDYTITVKSGDTMKRIANRVLGEGMECYIEVYNNISSGQALQEGQELKIPKLELKKKLKQKTE
jgi:nucleoid DNA-binding protein